MAGTKKKAKRYAVVACMTHGRESDKWDGRMVVVGIPRNTKQRNEGGCPICIAESRQVAA